jgi:hypothetical protein
MPPNHESRTALVNGDPALRPCREKYGRLFDLGFRARYTPGFRLCEHKARELVEVDLDAVRQAVQTALGLTESH